MKEEFLHYVWERGLYDPRGLTTVDGQPVLVFRPGNHNTNSGPDFLDARVRIGSVDWVGSVEIHVRSGEWMKHRHHLDPMYNSTVLHVCLIADEETTRYDLTTVPNIELKGRIPGHVKDRYDLLQNNSHWIPCAPFIAQTSRDKVKSTLEMMGYERLNDKSAHIQKLLRRYSGDWEHTFYVALAGGFGGNINKQPFVHLAESVPYQLIRKYQHKRMDIEAILFGVGGFLDPAKNDPTDTYVKELIERFDFLRHLHKFKPIDAHLWKFLRMRPANFPTVRLAEFCAVLHRHTGLFPTIRDNPDLKAISNMLEVEITPYWKDHYMLNGNRSGVIKTMGTDMRNELIINVISPFLMAYGAETGKSTYQKAVFKMLHGISAEKNKIINEFKSLGIKAENAFESQALLQLYRKRCIFKACTSCPVGRYLLEK